MSIPKLAAAGAGDKPATSATLQSTIIAALIDESEALRRVPVARRTWFDWRQRGLIPYIRPPGTKRILYHWPSVEAALLRMQRGGAA